MKNQDDNFGDPGEHSEEQKELIKQTLEERFKAAQKEGLPLTEFMYLPDVYVSDYVRQEIDTFLLAEAYRHLIEMEEAAGKDIVYQDGVTIMRVSTIETKTDLMNRMLAFFTSTEEYEKCAKVRDYIKTHSL